MNKLVVVLSTCLCLCLLLNTSLFAMEEEEEELTDVGEGPEDPAIQNTDEGEAGNGGGECERKIQYLRREISDWINRGGSKGLDFENTVVSSVEEYNEGMLNKLSSDVIVSCTTEVLKVGRAEKTCKNFPAKGDDKDCFICNFDRFMSTDESNQYVQVHHETAGLAGFEQNYNGDEESDYTISNQLTGFLQNQIVKKLSIKKIPCENANPANNLIFEDSMGNKTRLYISKGIIERFEKANFGHSIQCQSFLSYYKNGKRDSRYAFSFNISFNPETHKFSTSYDATNGLQDKVYPTLLDIDFELFEYNLTANSQPPPKRWDVYNAQKRGLTKFDLCKIKGGFLSRTATEDHPFFMIPNPNFFIDNKLTCRYIEHFH